MASAGGYIVPVSILPRQAVPPAVARGAGRKIDVRKVPRVVQTEVQAAAAREAATEEADERLDWSFSGSDSPALSRVGPSSPRLDPARPSPPGSTLSCAMRALFSRHETRIRSWPRLASRLPRSWSRRRCAPNARRKRRLRPSRAPARLRFGTTPPHDRCHRPPSEALRGTPVIARGAA